MSESKKPRLAEVLGVEVGQHFNISGCDGEYYINSYGEICYKNVAGYWSTLAQAINRPDLIKRHPRWTEQEIEDAKAVLKIIAGAVYIERLRATSRLCILDAGNSTIAFVNSELFPSVNNGEKVTLDDIIGGITG